jgi:hypothetical protein
MSADVDSLFLFALGLAANFIVTSGAYGFAFLTDNDDADGSDEEDKSQPSWLKFIYKSLDFGSGRERGVRK